MWLLLLPCPPCELSLITLRAAYGPTLTQALEKASCVSRQSDSILDIVIACDDDLKLQFLNLQKLLGLMYRLICVICTELQIDPVYDNDVDCRVTFFQKTLIEKDIAANELSNDIQTHGFFADLRTLARTNRDWQHICFPDGEFAEGLLRDFIQYRSSSSHSSGLQSQLERLSGGLTIRQAGSQGPASLRKPASRHHSVAVGGTFDHLHAGHKLLITVAVLVLVPESTQTRCLTVGITGDELLKKKEYQDELQDFFERQSAVQTFLLGILELISPNHVLINTRSTATTESSRREIHNTLKSGLLIKYVEIFDPYGPTITDEAISALVLSAETRNGGQAVNAKREDKAWPNLEIFEVGVLDQGESETDHADDKFQTKISSTDIRRRMHQKSAESNGRS